MKLATSAMITKIDEYSQNVLGIPISTLMERSGEAVARVVRERAPRDKHVVILAGKGNNGADGYAAAIKLMDEYDITVYDIFNVGQKNREGKEFLLEFKARGGKVEGFEPSEEKLSYIKSAGCIVDAVFGTGFHGEMPEDIRPLAITVRESVEAQKIAVDVPLGINADNGSVSEFAIMVSATVELSYIKPGIISYPARAYAGDIIYDDLGLPRSVLAEAFDFRYNMIDTYFVQRTLPKRENNSNKGSFGKLLMITGSQKYRGAAYLGLEAALRGGVGLVSFAAIPDLIKEISTRFPEAVYKNIEDIAEGNNEQVEELTALSSKFSATLIGSGSDNTDGLLKLTLSLLSAEGGPLILDADAINALSSMGEKGTLAIKNSPREVIITPHPLEFARLIGSDVASVQLHRIEYAERFAKENSCIVVLKGAGTIVTDGKDVHINTAGSSALAKAGSGDVLAGFMASFIAQGKVNTISAAALSVYFHAVAGDNLAEQFSSYGVTPSDLPIEMARQIAKFER